MGILSPTPRDLIRRQVWQFEAYAWLKQRDSIERVTTQFAYDANFIKIPNNVYETGRYPCTVCHRANSLVDVEGETTPHSWFSKYPLLSTSSIRCSVSIIFFYKISCSLLFSTDFHIWSKASMCTSACVLCVCVFNVV